MTAVIFDLDGTLITFNFNSKGTKTALLGELKALGIDTEGLDDRSPTQRILDRARDKVVRDDPASYPTVRRKLYDVIDRYEVESIAATSMFPGTRETLTRLKADGVALALYTNSGRPATDFILGRTGLSGLFDIILTRDDVDSMKPHPEGILKALSLLPQGTGPVYYVGDSPYDIEAAKKAGVRVISVPTGNYTAEVLRAEGADFLVKSLVEVPEILQDGR